MSTTAVPAPAEGDAWPAEVPAGAAFLDLEIQGDGSLQVGAMVSGGQPWVFTGEHLAQMEQVAPRVAVLAGHNVRRFDVPQLERLIGIPFPADLDVRVVDTLELASLVFPGEPSQALDKLYREQSSLSDPVQDCLESSQVLARCVRALPGVPGLVRSVARRLLPPSAARDLIPVQVPWRMMTRRPGSPGAPGLEARDVAAACCLVVR